MPRGPTAPIEQQDVDAVNKRLDRLVELLEKLLKASK